MSALAKSFVTPKQYLEAEHEADRKSKYFSGQIFAMTGASRRHNVLASNLVRRRGNRLDGRPARRTPVT